MTVAESFVRADLCVSRGKAQRLGTQGGLAIDEARIADVDGPAWWLTSTGALLRIGKKRSQRVRLV